MRTSLPSFPTAFVPPLCAQGYLFPSLMLSLPFSGYFEKVCDASKKASVTPAQNSTSLEKLKKRKERSWSLQMSKELSTRVQEYCEEHGTLQDMLSIDDFAKIAPEFHKSPEDCMIRFKEIHISGSTTAGVWSKAEDDLLSNAFKDGMNWKEVANYINSVIHSGLKVRTPKHCKERWNNHVDPLVVKGHWTVQEDRELVRAFLQHNKKWSLIAKIIKTRNENSVKNRINSLVHKERKGNRSLTRDEAIQRIYNRLNEIL